DEGAGKEISRQAGDLARRSGAEEQRAAAEQAQRRRDDSEARAAIPGGGSNDPDGEGDRQGVVEQGVRPGGNEDFQGHKARSAAKEHKGANTFAHDSHQPVEAPTGAERASTGQGASRRSVE